MAISWIRYRGLIAYFLNPLHYIIACFSDSFILTVLAQSDNVKLKEGLNKLFWLCIVFRKAISFINENFYFGDRAPLMSCM